MANIYKNSMFDLTTTNSTVVYTCPTDRTALTRVQFKMLSGNIDAGDICLYGIA